MGSMAQIREVEAKPRLTLLLAAPRGFCAGVDRAIRIVELALQKFGRPVYVRHEIVHNRFVVERLERMGAVFIDELDQAPAGARVIFSAHGVPKSVPAAAERRELYYLDATCPLVSKVHVEAGRHFNAGHQIVLIGHAGHPEVEGTIGQLPEGAMTRDEFIASLRRLRVQQLEQLAAHDKASLKEFKTIFRPAWRHTLQLEPNLAGKVERTGTDWQGSGQGGVAFSASAMHVLRNAQENPIACTYWTPKEAAKKSGVHRLAILAAPVERRPEFRSGVHFPRAELCRKTSSPGGGAGH